MLLPRPPNYHNKSATAKATATGRTTYPPSDLIRHTDRDSQLLCKCPHQARVLLEPPADDRNIEAFFEELVCLLAATDRTDGADEHSVADFFFYGVSEWLNWSVSSVFKEEIWGMVYGLIG